MDLATFGTEGSLASYSESLNLSLPSGIEEVMEKYSTYSVAVINMTTRSPIKEPFYGKLMNATPNAMNALIEYIADHPVVEVKWEPPAKDFLDPYFTPEFSSIRKSFGQELSVWGQFYNISTEEKNQLTRYFNLFAATMYGNGMMHGYTLSFDLPLYEEKAFFPLGTTVAWNGTDQVEVIFECDGDKEIEFDEEPHLECISDGSHYFIFQYTGTQPDHDLEGKYGGDVSGWKEMKFRMNGFLYDDPGMKGIILWGVLVLVCYWFAMRWIFRSLEYDNKSGKIGLSISILVFSLLFPILVGLLILPRYFGRRVMKNRYAEIMKNNPEKQHDGIGVDFQSFIDHEYGNNSAMTSIEGRMELAVTGIAFYLLLYIIEYMSESFSAMEDMGSFLPLIFMTLCSAMIIRNAIQHIDRKILKAIKTLESGENKLPDKLQQ